MTTTTDRQLAYLTAHWPELPMSTRRAILGTVALAVDRDGHRRAAEALVDGLLAEPELWPIPVRGIDSLARTRGLTLPHLSRAAHRRGVRVVRCGHGPSRQWVWHLPAHAEAS